MMPPAGLPAHIELLMQQTKESRAARGLKRTYVCRQTGEPFDMYHATQAQADFKDAQHAAFDAHGASENWPDDVRKNVKRLWEAQR